MMMNNTWAPKRQSGLSLIELMIAMALGLLLMSAVINMLMNGSSTNKKLQDSSVLNENGRFALRSLTDEIKAAGYYGLLDDYDMTLASLPAPCSLDVALLGSAIALPIQGYNDVGSTGGDELSILDACLPAGESIVAGSDVLITRGVDASELADPLSLAASAIYMQASSLAHIVGKGDASFNLTKRDGSSHEDIRLYQQNIFYLSAADEAPTLKLLSVQNGAFTLIPLAENVEEFQVEYGIDRSGDGGPNESTIGAGDRYLESPSSISDWKNVTSVNIALLQRGQTKSSGHEDRKVYDLGLKGTVGPMNDAYKRRLFASTTRVINVSMKREGL